MKLASETLPEAPGTREIWIKSGSTLSPRRVATGAASGELTEITDGLSDGEEIAVGLTAETASPSASAPERSPFMPTPPGGDDKKKK